MFDEKTIDIEPLIAQRRQSLGLDTGFDPKTSKELAGVSMQLTKQETDPRSLDKVSGLSSLINKSEETTPKVPNLFDDNEKFANYEKIKNAFLQKHFSFEDLLQSIFNTPSPSFGSKIFLKDFEKALMNCFSERHFSSFQIKQVFGMHAQDTQRGVDSGFISLRDFKDLYYPHRPWKSDFSSGANTKPVPAARPKGENEDEEALSEASMMLDDILQGRAIQDIVQERENAERKQMIDEAIAHKKFAAIKDDYETASNFSERIENIISVKSADPKIMKGQLDEKKTSEKTKGNNKKGADGLKDDANEKSKKLTFGNENFFRQQESRSTTLPISSQTGKKR